MEMTVRRHNPKDAAEGQIVIITGEVDQGQNIVAMSYIGQSLQDGETPFHNDCSNKGFRIRPEILAVESEFLELLDTAPDGSTFVLADADSVEALVGNTSEAIPNWLHLCRIKGHHLILTTVRCGA